MLNESGLAAYLATLDAEALAALLSARSDALGIPPSSLVDLADRLSLPQSVKVAVRGLNRMQAEVLVAAQGVLSGERITVPRIVERFVGDADLAAVEVTLAELTRLALMWPVDDAFDLVGPLREVHVRGRLELHARPAEPAWVPVGADAVDQAGASAVLPMVVGVTRLVELCSATPLDVLRGGGVGVKEVRRVAKTLAVTESQVKLWLALAYHADLLDNDDGMILPTGCADEWLAGSPADRAVPLLMTWWQLPSSPTAQPTALVTSYQDADRDLRHDLIGWFALRPAGDAIADQKALLATAAWHKPYVYGESETADAILAEAGELGVLASGALSSWGRALVGGREFQVADAVERWLPQPSTSVRLLPDLTAVVAGVPAVELSELLDLAADAGSRDTASVWRFSQASVRRALDAGYPADKLLAALRAAAQDGVPQPLEYLVRDVQRRHGELTVAAVGCCVLGDETLLREVSLRVPGTRLLAPGVLTSAKPIEATLELLRANGYAPVAVDAHGMPVLGRATPRRARPRPRVTTRTPRAPQPPEDVLDLAYALLEAGLPGPQDVVRQFGEHLTSEEITLLGDALDTSARVEITYLDGNDRNSRRVITPLDVVGGRMEAWCHLRDDERHFLISRIQRVEPAPV